MAQQYVQQLMQSVDGILFQLRVYQDAQRVRNDCFEVLRSTPSLQPRMGSLPRAPTQLLYLSGTIPIIYNNNQYNIPVCIWIPDKYPQLPPLALVTPTPGMVIKSKHKHVDSQGMCYFPYLSSWHPVTSNLSGLINTMCKAFSQDPPVRSGQANSAPPTSAQSTNPLRDSSSLPPYQRNSSPPQSRPPSVLSPPSNQSNKPYENQIDVLKRKATDKTQQKLEQFNKESSLEIDELMSKASKKESKLLALGMELDRLRNERDSFDQDVNELNERFEQVSTWLQQNDTTGEVDIDAVTEPRDPLSKQLLYLVAEDATIEDTLYILEKALGRGEIDTEVFLKTVRNLATDQFMVRATVKKVHERQRGKVN